ncbi:ABC transporter ATP-binding protein [Desulfosporosinus youngiae]|uniref:ABC-type multidrug transport system, ATPase and permease component n=1 Tax=Desulfosporosinus youngiae DSM 17734 TaxID=768710 RepID=H5Y5I8_9FIRM|nr:ABC transporter ATP-binding protein [Desulfosporosinus youngiae]EHQ90575.1 ABC-type multidrug transport system, ATPase and permease component [Desulfosporosinus youngiae DSM 17734]
MKLYRNYFRRYKVPFLAGVLCVTLEAVCDLLGPTLMAHIVNNGIEQGSLSGVYHWGTLMLAVTLIGACFAVTRNILASHVSQRMGANLRSDLFKKIISFSEDSADKIEAGSLITRMTNDTAQIVQFVNGIMRIFLKAPLTGLGSIILASLLNFRLSLIIYGVVAVVTLLIYISMKLSYPRFYQLQMAMDQVNLKVQEYLIGVRLVKAFGTYGKEIEKFDEENRNLRQRGISSQMVITLITPFLTLVVGVGTTAVIYLGSRLFMRDLANVGDMTAFTIYMAQILISLIMITNVFTMFVRTKASTARIREVLDSGEDFAPSQATGKLQGRITFDQVTFAYPKGSGVPAIRELSFTVNPGESLAIIGPTGSGKSTIAWLLLRFYDVDSGAIILDNSNLKELGSDVIRSNIAIVPQKPMLFSGSVAENLRWGNQHASPDQLKQAAEKAQADFIVEMAEGYDSLLGSAGVNLSGGQKQRISLARAILKKAPVLILDDATSALDAVTEAKVRENLKHQEDQQTVIIITQRCGTAMSADQILVMENGRKVGWGTHEELLRSCEVYQDIYHTQIESSREG